MEKKLEINEVLTVKDVQRYLNVSQTTAYKLFSEKDFPSFSVGGSKRIAKDDFFAWLDKQKHRKEA